MDFTDVDKAILKELREGARTQGFLVDATETPRYKIHERLQLLTAASYIENTAFTSYGRTRGPTPTDTEAPRSPGLTAVLKRSVL